MGEINLEPGRSRKDRRKARHPRTWASVALLFFAAILLGAYHFEVLPFARETADTVNPGNLVGGSHFGQGGLDTAKAKKAGRKRGRCRRAGGTSSWRLWTVPRPEGLYVTMDVFGTPSRFAEVITFITTIPG